MNKIIKKGAKVDNDALMEKVMAFKKQAGIKCDPPSLMATAAKAKALIQKEEGKQ